MNDTQPKSLLPNGLRDSLPPEAGWEARAISQLLDVFHANGYDRVDPPLVEFEQSLLDGPGQVVSPQTFRLMDPVSQRMMGLRADITPQIARLASTRLIHTSRPLRLSYAGQVLRVRGNQLRPERQFAQVGVELIGGPEPDADVEVVVLAAESLAAIGITDVSLDLSLPTLVPVVCQDIGLSEGDSARARIALDRKDPAALSGFETSTQVLLTKLLEVAGPANQAIEALDGLVLSDRAKTMCLGLKETVERVVSAAPDLSLTIDPVEFRGMEYQTGVSFTIFTKQVRSEVGRGGRYELNSQESATGFTMFMDAVIRALPEAEDETLVFIPHGSDPKSGARIRVEGWRTLQGLSACDDNLVEARRLNCSHLLQDGEIILVS